MGHADAHAEADDACRALERVGSAHARLELFGGHRIALQRQQACSQHLDLTLRFQTEKLQHRQLAQVFGFHATLRFRV